MTKTTTKKSESQKIAGIRDEVVVRRTGRSWSDWLAELDKAGAEKMSHKEIAERLWEAHPEIGGWWCQMITVGYEQARGKRVANETPDGFQVGASKTIRVPVAKLYQAWAEEATRDRWLPDAPLTVRKATAAKSMRIGWEGGASRIAVYFTDKGPAKSQVAVNHERLPDTAAAERMKAFWKERLARLAELLEKAS
ncbi:MAG: hypothetical protein H0W36_14210 [Gemmatimonadetes bacterium]|nr:hypothetical protein [Gemmatimonadota bacterium]